MRLMTILVILASNISTQTSNLNVIITIAMQFHNFELMAKYYFYVVSVC